MQKISNFIKSEKYKKNIAPEIKRTILVVIFTMIYGLGLVWFLEASAVPMYAGGVPGIGQLVRDFMYFRLNIDMGDHAGLFLALFTIIGNIPIILLGWFGVSKKFTLYSILSIVLQATILGFIPHVNLGLEGMNHTLMNAIMGGALIGIGVGGCLRIGASTGGLDIVGQYFALRNGRSVGFISMVLNVSIAIIGAIIVNGGTVEGVTLIGGMIATYTIIRIVISMILTDRIHTAYQYLAIEIITSKTSSLVEDIINQMYRGVTITTVEGAYSKEPRQMITCIISSYELSKLQEIIHQSDEKAFVVIKPVKKVIGNFKRRTIT